MLMIISPAKKLNRTPENPKNFTEIELQTEYQKVLNELQKQSIEDLRDILKVSINLAEQAYDDNQKLSNKVDITKAKQAIKLFQGDVYSGMDNGSLNQSDLEYLQKHLRIISALYGVIRPLDLIEPYRLEMNTTLEIEGKKAKDFWKPHSFKAINNALKEAGSPIINLASKEYFEAVDQELLNSEVIDTIFQDMHKGQYKTISIYAKKARGMMVRYAADNKITDAEKLKNFDVDGYSFNKALSSGKSWVFTRG